MKPVGSGAGRPAGRWQLRFVTDEIRAREMERLYRELGFQTRLEPAGPADVRTDCGECPVVRLGLLRRVSTRRPEEGGDSGEERA